MEKPQHTPGPWVYYDDSGEFGKFTVSTPRNEVYDGGREIAVCHEMTSGGIVGADADGRRIVACVNACEGINTEALENGAVKDLLEAARLGSYKLREILHVGVFEEHEVDNIQRTIMRIDAAIAKATGGTQ